MPISVRPHGIEDQQLARALDDIALKAEGPGLFSGAVRLDKLVLTNDVQRIRHNLGRRATGYMVLRTRSLQPRSQVASVSPSAGDSTVWTRVGNTATAQVWTSTAASQHLKIPLPVVESTSAGHGMFLQTISVVFNRGGAVNPTIQMYRNRVAATAASMGLTFSNPSGTGVYEALIATANTELTTSGYYLNITSGQAGDLVSQVLMTFYTVDEPYCLVDENEGKTDTDKFIYLKTVGAGATVDIAVF